MTVKESTELAVLEKLTPAVIFAPGGVDAILEKIKTEVRHTPVDISTKTGRENVASLAYKVARSKTALDKMGKDLGETHYKSWKAITSERARIEKELDDLRDEVRKPLTDFENAEKDRVAAHEAALAAIEVMGQFDTTPSAADIKYRLDALICLPPREWQEFAKRAADLEQSVIAALNGRYEEASRREAEAAELARLRTDEIERQRKERDAKIAAEAAERARIEAEQKAAREAEEAARAAEIWRDRIEREKAAALAKAAQAEADRKAAIAKAEQDAKDAAEAAERRQASAIETERKRVADEAAKVAADTAAREADKKHRASVHNAVMLALIDLGVDKDISKGVVVALAKRAIPHIKIEY
jgi:colicin import membrane protein